MITIIQATNRPDSSTEFVSRHIQDLLISITSTQVGYVSMADIPSEIIHCDPYEEDSLPQKIITIQDQFMIPAEKFIWIVPEYNGSFPGILKLFIDSISVRFYNETFPGKKSAVIGITSGRSGNIRGMDHLTSILMHMKSIVYPRLLPISRISELMDANGKIIHDQTVKVLNDHIRGFLEF